MPKKHHSGYSLSKHALTHIKEPNTNTNIQLELGFHPGILTVIHSRKHFE